MPDTYDRIVFLDRDGTINDDTGYISKPDEVSLLPGAAEAMKKLRPLYALCVVTNQSGISRGFYGHEDVAAVNRQLCEYLEEQGAEYDTITYCPHQKADKCDCRKPFPRMLEESVDKLLDEGKLSISDIKDAKSLWMVGDRSSDIEAGHAFGAKTILLPEPHDAPPLVMEPDFRAGSLMEAAEIIMREDKLAVE